MSQASSHAARAGSRVLLVTFGCRAAQADEVALGGELVALGLDPVGDPRTSDPRATVVSGCVVTARAERDARRAIRRMRREHAGALLVAAGCVARSHAAGRLRDYGVDLVFDGSDPADLARMIADRLAGRARHPSARSCKSRAQVRPLGPAAPGAREARAPGPPQLRSGFAGRATSVPAVPGIVARFERARVPLRIQDGCDGTCAYCVVPAVRGPCRSVPAEAVIERFDRLAARGVAEVILTGIQTGAWGIDLDPPSTLPDLLEALLRRTEGPRIRVSSIEPHYLTGRLVEMVVGSGRICPHLHVPIQSGSRRLLAAMGRQDPGRVVARLERTLRRHPSVAVGFDLITGLPGESETDFAQTVDLTERLPLAYLHVFTFSPRPGTRAAVMGPRVAERTAVLRTRALLRADERLRREYRKSLVGREAEVAVESIGGDGTVCGTTERFVPAVVLGVADPRPGTLVAGTIDSISSNNVARVPCGAQPSAAASTRL